MNKAPNNYGSCIFMFRQSYVMGNNLNQRTSYVTLMSSIEFEHFLNNHQFLHHLYDNVSMVMALTINESFIL